MTAGYNSLHLFTLVVTNTGLPVDAKNILLVL